MAATPATSPADAPFCSGDRGDTIKPSVFLTAVAVAMVATMASGCTTVEIQPGFAQVAIGPAPIRFRVDVAETPEQQRNGLRGREPLPPGTGMLFRFESRDTHQVWMAGMTMPLDIAWISGNKIVAVDTLQPCTQPDQDQCRRSTSPPQVDSLLEVPAQSLTDVSSGMTITVDQ